MTFPGIIPVVGMLSLISNHVAKVWKLLRAIEFFLSKSQPVSAVGHLGKISMIIEISMIFGKLYLEIQNGCHRPSWKNWLTYSLRTVCHRN